MSKSWLLNVRDDRLARSPARLEKDRYGTVIPRPWKRLSAVIGFFFLSQAVSAQTLQNNEEILVIGTTPGSALGQAVNDLPFDVKSANADELRDSLSLDLSDFMNSRLGSVSINSAQGNPLQPDVQFRGYTASPLLGLSQGIAVYQNGVRINEPMGDAVHWDLLPESAIQNIDMISGANPLFGLNALGGALIVSMKDGFSSEGNEIEFYSGSWNRSAASFQSGGNNGTWGYYVNVSRFDEDGWRNLSKSSSTGVYSSLSWRDGETGAFNLNYQQGDSNLRGNGAAPVGLLSNNRADIFTAPDITRNDLQMFSLDGSRFLTDNIQLSTTIFSRKNRTDSFNGDTSEYGQCDYAGGNQSLFDDVDDIEDILIADLNIDLDDICNGGDPNITSFAELQSFIESEATSSGLDPDIYELDDLVGALSGTGTLSDEAINNVSVRFQDTQGIDINLSFLDDLFGRSNRLTIGGSLFEGKSLFDSILELSGLDPGTRSTEGLGTGTFVDEAETHIKTQTRTASLFLTNTIDLNDNWTVTLAARYNDTDVTLRDRTGERPELNGDHRFRRINPSVGMTYSPNNRINWYGSYSESNRVPTPIELACNEGVFELAQEFAVANGEDPDDIDFECRLPNAFLADPPLDDVVTRNLEFGVRGITDNVAFQAGIFHATNQDDIIFQTTGRSTGLFANVNKTRRMGVEINLNGTWRHLDWYAAFSHLEATFEDSFTILSPNHPNANNTGIIDVQSGDRIPGLPRRLVKIGGNLRVMKDLNIGVEAFHNANQVLRGDESNDLNAISGYTVANLRANYDIGEKVSMFAKLDNVFDTEFENFGLLGESPGEVLGNLADVRPIFLGAGAPRAAWVGVRIKF